jgi:hypothetical protein
MRKPTKNQSELNFWGVVTGIHGVSLASEAFRYHPQIVTQRFVALLDVVSNFAAFKICDQRVGTAAKPPFAIPSVQLLCGSKYQAQSCCRPVSKSHF